MFNDDNIEQLHVREPFISECVLKTDLADINNLIDGADTSIDNCKYYTNFDNKYGCITCKNGFTGIIATVGQDY